MKVAEDVLLFNASRQILSCVFSVFLSLSHRTFLPWSLCLDLFREKCSFSRVTNGIAGCLVALGRERMCSLQETKTPPIKVPASCLSDLMCCYFNGSIFFTRVTYIVPMYPQRYVSSSCAPAQCDIHYARACSINMTERDSDDRRTH